MSIAKGNAPDLPPKQSPTDGTLGGVADSPLTRRGPRDIAKKRSGFWPVLFVLIAIGAGAAAYFFFDPFGGSDEQLIYYTVKRGDLLISVSERGTIESQENIEVRCEVDDVPGDNLRGTPIRWIIRNGASVKKGDLLVEMESANHVERLDRQVLARENALAEKIQAEAKHDNQKTQNETLKANAELEVDLAKLELEMFKDKKSGTYKLEVEDIQRKIDDINTEILAAKAALEVARKDLQASESLFELGYAGKSDLDRSKLEVLQAEAKYASKMNGLGTQMAALDKKRIYEKKKQIMTLEGNRATSKRKLIQVERDNEALLAQAKAKRDAAVQSFNKEDELLTRYKDQVKKCRIHAPVDGMVAYAVADTRRWWMEEIRQGSPVNRRQHILSIPNLSKMQVKTTVHESVIDQIREGLNAIVRIEAFPDKHFNARVKAVAVLADQEAAETKVYETIVAIDGDVHQLKPGMTAVVDIQIDRVKDALSIPVQAIVQIGRDSWCYVDNGNGREQRVLKLGRTNHKFVEIRDGLEDGDRVVLNPMVLVEEREESQKSVSPDEDLQVPLAPAPKLSPKKKTRKRK